MSFEPVEYEPDDDQPTEPLPMHRGKLRRLVQQLRDELEQARVELEQLRAQRDGDMPPPYPGRPGDGWRDFENDVWVHCADGQMRLLDGDTDAVAPADADAKYGPMLLLDAHIVEGGDKW